MKERSGEKTVVVVVVEIEIVHQNHTGASWRVVAFCGCGSFSGWRAGFITMDANPVFGPVMLVKILRFEKKAIFFLHVVRIWSKRLIHKGILIHSTSVSQGMIVL